MSEADDGVPGRDEAQRPGGGGAQGAAAPHSGGGQGPTNQRRGGSKGQRLRRGLVRFWGESVVVPNQGSAARDHLANERTFLAWVRTALGIIGLGVVVTKLVASEHVLAEVAGLTFIVLGVAGIAYALERYRKITNHLATGEFPVARWGPLALGGVVLLVAVVAAFLVLR